MLKNFLLASVVVIGAGIYTLAEASVSYKHARQLFNKLSQHVGRHVIFDQDEGGYINAYTTPHKITVTRGLLRFVNSDGELMGVLGHEMSHYINGDPTRAESSYLELRADKQGVKWCLQMGYKDCTKLMYRMRAKYGDAGRDGVHPGWSERIRNVLR